MTKKNANALVDTGVFLLTGAVTYVVITRPERWSFMGSILLTAAMLLGLGSLVYGAINGVVIRVNESLHANQPVQNSTNSPSIHT